MGIKSLTKLIKENAGDSIQTKKLYQLSGKKVAIDISIFIYQYLITDILIYNYENKHF